MKEREFVSYWLQNLQNDGLKEFPADFIQTENCLEISMPRKTLVLGKEFFGEIEITTIDGELFKQVKSISHAKYFVYANKNMPLQINIPENENEVEKAVSSYENYIDSLIRLIGNEYKKKFPGEKNQQIVINNILRALNIVRY